MYKSTDKDIWRVFRGHHYLTQEMNKGATVYLLYWGDTLVGFNSFLNMPSGTNKYCYRTHRLVILPDYQNLGLGTKFEEFMGEYFIGRGEKMFLRTTHLRLGKHCNESNKWISTATNCVKRTNANEDNKNTTQGAKYKKIDDTRIAYSFEYVGSDYNSKPHQNIICLGDDTYENAVALLDKAIDKDKFPIIVTSIADVSQITNFEKVARERGIRTEILYVKQKGIFKVVNKQIANKHDCIVCDNAVSEEVEMFKKNLGNVFTINLLSEKPIKEYVFGNIPPKYISAIKQKIKDVQDAFCVKIIYGDGKRDHVTDMAQELGIDVEPLYENGNIKNEHVNKKIIGIGEKNG